VNWGSNALGLLADVEEVEVETTRPDGSRLRTVIWVVVDGDDVFVRSVRGDRGRWWQAATDRPDEVALLVGGHRVEVRALPATDEGSVTRCSEALGRKYAGDPSTPSMLKSQVLATTLRLEQR
jgi:hypothetical protein